MAYSALTLTSQPHNHVDEKSSTSRRRLSRGNSRSPLKLSLLRSFSNERPSLRQAFKNLTCGVDNIERSSSSLRLRQRRRKKSWKVNKEFVIRIWVDNNNYNTIRLNENTTVRDVIQKLSWRRSTDPSKAAIELNGVDLPPEKRLFPMFADLKGGKQPVLSFISARPRSESNRGSVVLEDALWLSTEGEKTSSSMSHSLSSTKEISMDMICKPCVETSPVKVDIETLIDSSHNVQSCGVVRVCDNNGPINRGQKMISRMDILPTFSVVRDYADEEKGKRLPDVRDWNVIKINRKGKRQRRILSITRKGIKNIRARTGTVSSEWTWGDIRTVFRVNKNKVNFKLSDSKDRVYETDEAEKLLKNVQEHIAYHNEQVDAWAAKDISKKLQKRCCDQRKKGLLRASTEYDLKHIFRKSRCEQEEAKSKVAQQVEKWLNDRETKFSQYVKNFVIRWKKRYRKQVDCLHSARMLMDQLKDAIMEEKAVTLMKLAFPNKHQLSAEDNIFIDSEVEKSIEQYVVPQILDDLVAKVSQENSATTILLRKNSARLKHKDLSFYHCSDKVLEMSKLHNWDGAMLELIKLPREVLPSKKLRVVDNTVRVIYSLAAMTRADSQLAGDDLLPILLYVMVQATNKLNKLVYSFADHHFIDQLISKDNLSGDKEYYLTVFEACLYHLAHPDCLN